MSQTRADLDRKLALLEVRAKEMSPKRYAREHIPEFFVDQAIGSVLTLIGLRMAWGNWRRRQTHRQQVRAALASYGRW